MACQKLLPTSGDNFFVLLLSIYSDSSVSDVNLWQGSKMKKVTIKKYVSNQLAEEITVPVMFISLLQGLLPASALETLKQSGFNFDQIVQSARTQTSYQAESIIEEHGVEKRIEIVVNP